MTSLIRRSVPRSSPLTTDSEVRRRRRGAARTPLDRRAQVGRGDGEDHEVGGVGEGRGSRGRDDPSAAGRCPAGAPRCVAVARDPCGRLRGVDEQETGSRPGDEGRERRAPGTGADDRDARAGLGRRPRRVGSPARRVGAAPGRRPLPTPRAALRARLRRRGSLTDGRDRGRRAGSACRRSRTPRGAGSRGSAGS